MIRAGIITASDKGAAGQREDQSGPAIQAMLEPLGTEIVETVILPDDVNAIAAKLRQMADSTDLDLVLTTGGTGLGPRDVTPEATRQVIDREVPGIAEAMRRESLRQTPHAMLSRAIAGIRGRTLIINLPGSPKAVRECLAVILPALPHGIEVLRGEAVDCARLREKPAEAKATP